MQNNPLPQALELLKVSGQDYIIATLNYVCKTANIPDEQAFVETLHASIPKEISEEIMTYEEILLERGRKQGFQKGLQAGKQEGKQKGQEEVLQQIVKKLIERGYPIVEINAIAEEILEHKAIT